MALLHARGADVVLVFGSHLLRAGASVDAAAPPVEAGVVADVVDVDVLHVGVVDDGAVHVHDRGVVGEVTALPTTAEEADATVTEAVVNTAVEADMRTPVAAVEDEGAPAPAPVAGGPEQTIGGGLHPDAGDPVIATRTVGPVARRPKIAIAGAERLRVHGQHGGRESHRDNDGGVRRGGRQNRGQHGCDSDGGHHEELTKLPSESIHTCLLHFFSDRNFYCFNVGAGPGPSGRADEREAVVPPHPYSYWYQPWLLLFVLMIAAAEQKRPATHYFTAQGWAVRPAGERLGRRSR